MREALARVKKDLGPRAVILHTRTLKRGGLLGFGSRDVVEITATTDQRVAALRKTEQAGNARTHGDSKAALWHRRPAGDSTGETPVPQMPVPQTPVPQMPVPQTPVPQMPVPQPGGDQTPHRAVGGRTAASTRIDPALRSEMGEIRTMVKDLLHRSEAAAHPEAPAELIDYYTHLLGQDVANELALDVVRQVGESLNLSRSPSGDPPSPQRVREALCKVLASMLPRAAPLELTAGPRPTVVAFVGPTGVGKTTTIAKLAANMKLRENRRVGLVTIDSYRIAAVEQLKTYAQILKVPLASVLTPQAMREAIAKMSDCDLILIDTAGRSQRDALRIAELGEFLDAAKPDQVHLVLATTTGEATISQAIERFSKLGARRLIFTKVDEAVGFGVILNVLKKADVRLSYLTTGQAVPDDIEIGSAGRVAQMIVGDVAAADASAQEVRPGRPAREAVLK